jgi:hypothetical protein
MLQKLTPLKKCGTLVEDLISPCGDERFNSSYIQPINWNKHCSWMKSQKGIHSHK